MLNLWLNGIGIRILGWTRMLLLGNPIKRPGGGVRYAVILGKLL